MRKCKIDLALDALNKRRGLSHTDIGYSYYADIRGDGVKRPRTVWTQNTEHGGVTRSDLNGKTPRETLARINATIPLVGCEAYVLIIRAIHERGLSQSVALCELSRRGLWLSEDQKKQAGLIPST